MKIWYQKLIRRTIIAALCIVSFAAKSSADASGSEQLIIFVQKEASAVEKVFYEKHFPKIRDLAETMGVSVNLVDASKGSPGEVAITPLIIYQNYRGRSIYQGRTSTPARIRNFVRTSRYVVQDKESNRREQIPIWQYGRARIWAPLKVSGVTGSLPENYDEDDFVKYALKQIGKGFKKFRMQTIADLSRADRGFYMDFYPWLSEDGTLFLSLALYSQFHCTAPVFEKKITGSWVYRKKLFRKAAILMEEKVAEIISDPASGDSFDPVDTSVAEKNWDQIGYPLPPPPKSKVADVKPQTKIPQNWMLAKSEPDDPPMIQFRFPAPLDNYAGEVVSGKGNFYLPQNLIVDNAKGFIEIDTQHAITMGDPVLDDAIRGRMMLDSKKYPIAKFVVKSIGSDGRPIAYGRLTPARVEGTFILKGKNVPLISLTEIEPVIGEDGQPRLLMHGSFKIDLQLFNIEGADGPAPARHTLLFDVNFVLKANSL
jgi:hypothetical protein